METPISRLPYYDKMKKERYIHYKQKYIYFSWEEIVTYVNIGLDVPFYCEVLRIAEPGRSTVLVNKYRKLDSSYIPGDLEPIDQRFNPEGLRLRSDARIAFELMCEAAAEEGLHLEAVSTFRGFAYQCRIYYKNAVQESVLEEYQAERDKVSARAGHSEHQTGLAVDINELEETFENTPEGKWLAKNAYRFGFILRYPKGKEWITGYSYEPWHFRYLGLKLAEDVYQSKLTYDEFYVRYLGHSGV